MKELLRLQNLKKYGSLGYELRGYNLILFQGEILYIQGISGCGKNCLAQIMSGRTQHDEGNVFLLGEFMAKEQAPRKFAECVGTIERYHPMVGDMSVLDNLETLRPVAFPLKMFDKELAAQRVQKILDETDIKAFYNTKVEELTFLEEQKLCIIKLISCGKKLIIIDCVKDNYGDGTAEAIGEFIREKAKEGTSFLIVSEKPNPFVKYADRVQIIHQGVDLMEWREGEYQAEWLKTYTSNSANHDYGLVQDPDRKTGEIMLFLDQEWAEKESEQSYFRDFYVNNPTFWDQYFQVRPMTPEAYFDGESVLVPRDSADLLLINMSLEDNLSICVPQKTGHWKFRMISKVAKDILIQDFLKLVGRTEPVNSVLELNRVERKILSIHRWELTRPGIIFLENPFWGLDVNEIQLMTDYIQHLKKRNMKVAIYTNYLESSLNCVDIFFTCENARMAKIATKEQIVPL